MYSSNPCLIEAILISTDHRRVQDKFSGGSSAACLWTFSTVKNTIRKLVG
ncbi:hypothetical protein HanRHA438_Chr09g0402181 [Helianthus annuus]|nr:hypothetical protein HanRHA438_Chr09g0402181 [Helianthus annuus]